MRWISKLKCDIKIIAGDILKAGNVKKVKFIKMEEGRWAYFPIAVTHWSIPGPGGL